MHDNASAPSNGRQWEIDFFGLSQSAELDYLFPPKYLDFGSSMDEIVRLGYARRDEEGWSYRYDPESPNQSTSRKLWKEVMKNLPPYDRGRSEEPLMLYLALGCTSMDYHHGVDAFFRWRGKFVTFDASVYPKKRLHRSFKGLKANFLVTPNKTVQGGLARLGRDIAMTLKNQAEKSARSVIFKPRLPIREVLRTNRE